MRGDRARPVLALVLTLAGLLVVPLLVPFAAWTAVPWIVVGLAGGVVAGRLARVWTAWLGAAIGVPYILALREITLNGKLLPIGVAVSIALVAVLLTIGFLIGGTLAAPRRAWPALRADWRGLGRPIRWATALAIVGTLAGLTFYTAYVGANGADDWAAIGENPDCRTPAVFGWAYEAVNYNQVDDANLQWSLQPDKDGTPRWWCPNQGAAAGTDVVTSDGVHIGGWFIPAAGIADPSAPTVVIVPGANSDKSGMLAYAQPLHEKFNLVLLDDRGNGRSVPAVKTLGLREYLDVMAMVDWLVRVKHPTWIGALGDSLGAQTALAAAVNDQRIRALVLDSMHAHAFIAAGNIMQTEDGLPPMPGAVAIIGITSLRIGGDIAAVDPATMITRLRNTPVLLIHGTSDVIDVPPLSVELVVDAARLAGVSTELHFCDGGTHGALVDNPACATEWATWVNTFLQNSIAH